MDCFPREQWDCGPIVHLHPYNPPDGPPHPLPLQAKHLSPGVPIGSGHGSGHGSFRSGSTRMTHCRKTLNLSDALVALPALWTYIPLHRSGASLGVGFQPVRGGAAYVSTVVIQPSVRVTVTPQILLRDPEFKRMFFAHPSERQFQGMWTLTWSDYNSVKALEYLRLYPLCGQPEWWHHISVWSY
jgi:hypothetical protein